MRILFYDGVGAWTGAARVLARAAHGLASLGHHVTFVCPAESWLERHLTFDSFEIVPAPHLTGAAGAWRLHRELSQRFVEVVFVSTAREHVLASFAARLAKRAAIIRRIGHGETLRPEGPLALRLTATGFLFATEDELRRSRLPRAARLEPVLVPMGVSPDDYADVRPAPPFVINIPETGARHVVCVYDSPGRMAATTVLRVMAMLCERHPDIRLTLVGTGSQSDDLRMHAAALRITGRVTFLGARDDELEVLRTAELGWVAAGGDAGAWGLLDFAALGVPVLAERSALSRRYVAHGISGLLLPPGQPADAAGMVASLLASTEERKAMGVAARSRVYREFAELEMIAAFERAALAAADRTKW